MKLILSLCFLVVSSVLFGQQSEFGWLVGTWQAVDENSFEVWKDEGSFLSASSYKIDKSGNKTVTEEIRLIKKENSFYYIPDVAGPQGPVEFKITFFDKNSFTAENPAHDFPKKIIYKRMDDLHLQAWVGADKYLSHFLFTKIK